MMGVKGKVIFLFGSTLFSVFIGVISSVINTNFLSPVFYGDFRYIQNIISFISSLLMFGFFTSGCRLLALSKDELYSRKIRGVLSLILMFTVLILMFVLFILYLFNVNRNDSLANLYLIAIPFSSNVILLNYINTVAQGDNHIFRIAIARVLPSLLYCVVSYIIYSIYGATPVLMLILYNGIAIIVLSIIIISTKPSFSDLRESYSILKKENKLYGKNVYIGSIVGVSTTYIAGITLGQFCDTNADVGFYTLALTMSSPLSLLPGVVGTTFFKDFAFQNKIDRKVFSASLFLTIFSCIVYILFIKYIVKLLYDENYISVATYASCLALGMSIHGMGDMLNRFLGAHGQGVMLRNAAFVCGLVLTLGSVILVYFYGIWGAVLTKVMSSVSYFVILFIYYKRFINR